MNKLAVKVFGEEEVARMVELRMGSEQIKQQKRY